MADLYSSDLGGNTRKALPTSQFGTRKLSFCVVDVTDIGVDYTLQNSVFYQTIRAIQQNVEIYAVGTPSTNQVIIVVAGDTEPFGTNEATEDGGTNSYLESVLDEAGISATVWNAALSGDTLNYD